MKIESKEFNDLSVQELYSILKIRQEVFIIEQNCNYLDCDNLDLNATHIYIKEDLKLIAYLRIIKPNIVSKNAILGRILVDNGRRKQNIGKKIISYAIKLIKHNYPNVSIEMSAQAYLIDFYNQFGFNISGKEYLEDDILHIKMIKKI
tara:strand:- start:166 stop:609 length:444 start_codon:yes stop_codon:yes gene_type:complete